MQNGIIIILIGVIVILLGVLYAGDDFNLFSPSAEMETEEEVEDIDWTQSTGVGESGPNQTGATTPVSVQGVPSSGAGSANERLLQSGVVIVTYTDEGFVPPVIEVRAGEQVHFINRSSKGLWVTADLHPTATEQRYPEFDLGKTIPNGGTYTFVFTKVGVWGYKNLNDERHLGTVSVIKQD